MCNLHTYLSHFNKARRSITNAMPSTRAPETIVDIIKGILTGDRSTCHVEREYILLYSIIN